MNLLWLACAAVALWLAIVVVLLIALWRTW